MEVLGSGWLGFGGVESVCLFVAVVRFRSVRCGAFRRFVAGSVGGWRLWRAGSVLAFSAWSAPGNSPALASVTTLLRGTSGVQPRDSEQ